MTIKIKLFTSLYFTIFTFVNSHPRLKDIHDFAWLTTEPYFIDKTELLALLFEDEKVTSNITCHFLTLPFHFGKRKNLYMVQKFAGIEVEPDGRPKIWMETEAAKIFLHLNIGKYPYVISKHLARYPVIFLDLSVSKRDRLDDIPRILKNALRKSLHDYKWLREFLRTNMTKVKKNFAIDDYDARFFVKVCDEDLTDKELDDGLFRIGKLLFEYFKRRKVILLVDEYEKVALHGLASGNKNSVAFYEKLNKMLARALGDGDKYFEKTIITGTGTLGLSISNHAMFNVFGYTFGRAERNFEITHHAFLDDHPFGPYFGFHENDIAELCRRYESKNNDKNLMKKLYQGYLTRSNRTMVYNPSSIACFFQTVSQPYSEITDLSDHWIDPDWQTLLVSFMHSEVFRDKMQEALNRGFFHYPIKKQLPANSLAELIELANDKFKKITDKHVDMFFTIAFEQGYFSHDGGRDVYSVPNRDVELVLRLQFEKYYDE